MAVCFSPTSPIEKILPVCWEKTDRYLYPTHQSL